MAIYKQNSPYSATKIVGKQYLDLFSIRPVPAEDDDKLYTIEEQK